MSSSDEDDCIVLEGYGYDKNKKSGTLPKSTPLPTIRDSIFHIFLPKRTPENRQENLEVIESYLLSQTISSVDNFDFPQLESVKVMLRKWKLIQPDSDTSTNDFEDIFTHEVSGMEIGATIAIYARQQNCTMMISKLQEGIRIQTFRASLPSEMIMSSTRSKQMMFPETSEIIKNMDLLSSKAYARQLHELILNDFEFPMENTETGEKFFVEMETRDVPKPFLISDWAIGILVPSPDSSGIAILKKKIRDQVTMRQLAASFPFRRSGMWMSIKVALHLKILEALNGHVESAELTYKIIMLHILASVCELYHHKLKEKIDLDLTCQMMAKVGRRVLKLNKRHSETSYNGLGMDLGISNTIESMRKSVLEYTESVLFRLKTTAFKRWNKCGISRKPKRKGKKSRPHSAYFIERSKNNFRKDLNHVIVPLDIFAEDVKREEISSVELDTETWGTPIKRYDTLDSIMESSQTMRNIGGSNSEKLKKNQRIWLLDTEHFIKFSLTESVDHMKLFDLCQIYVSVAKDMFAEDPVGFSQMILVTLKVVNILDKIATRTFPLLLEYKPNIHLEKFDNLLIPHVRDIKLLDELLDYFSSRNEGAVSGRCVVEKEVDAETFSVRFAAKDDSMIQLRSSILNDTDKAMQQKYQEADIARESCRDLEHKISALGCCSCEYELKQQEYWVSRAQEYRVKMVKRKISTCKYCIFKKQLKSKRYSVAVYERPLPLEELFQYAVVFELLIPNQIFCLREMLAMLKYELMAEKAFEDGNEKVATKWLEYKKISDYSPSSSSSSSLSAKTISLGSTLMPYSETSFFKIYSQDLLLSTNADYIQDNGMGCCFGYEEKRPGIKNFKEKCTFQLNNARNSMSYQSLQIYLASTSHSQNEVISDQASCHQNISHKEFITFGSVRAGNRVQLRNLYRAISSRSLALDHEAVLALILQSIWQVGSRNAEGHRESYADFQDVNFTTAFLDMLDTLVKKNRSNYSDPLILVIAVLITTRIMELNDNKISSEKCYALLKTWRNLTEMWSVKIEEKLKCVENNSSQISLKEILENALHHIKICSLFTYGVTSNKEIGTLNDEEDIAHFLLSLHRQYELEKQSNPSFSKLMEVLKWKASNIAPSLRLEVKICQNDRLKAGVLRFVASRWNKANEYENHQILPSDSSSSNICRIAYSSSSAGIDEAYVTIDLITGEFLVNGNPQSELSSQISGNKEFQRFFQKYKNFRVQRESKTVLRTIHEFHGKIYVFKTHVLCHSGGPYPRKTPELIIVENKEGANSVVLIPHEIFRDYISDSFIDNYTHWIDLDNKAVYFRRIAQIDTDYESPPDYVLRKIPGSKEWRLNDNHSQDFILSIKSQGQKKVAKALSGLELCTNINVVMDKGENVMARLPRHNLRFSLNTNGNLESLEHPGFQISLEQMSFGTLLGLKNSLLLDNGTKSLIIIPHGTIKASKSGGDAHHASRIMLNDLNQPSFFIYELDKVLERLVAQKSISAWLYLAALHAVTSSSFPDPFTKMTGTEMAVNILQSGFVWSCSPYDEESERILEFVKHLAPKRNYYVNKFHEKRRTCEETIEWPEGLPSMAAYDGYAILVNKLVDDSKNLIKLHPNFTAPKQKESEEEVFSKKLQVRSYFRHISLYNDAVALDADCISSFPEQTSVSVPMREDQTNLHLQPMLTAAFMCHHFDSRNFTTTMVAYFIRKNLLTEFLLTESPLIIPDSSSDSLNQANSTIMFSLLDLFNTQFRSNWLQYYLIAKSKKMDKHAFNLLLYALAYTGVPIEQIGILKVIELLPDSDLPEVPRISCVNVTNESDDDLPEDPSIACIPTKSEYVEAEITSMLMKHKEDFPKSSSGCSSNDDYEQFYKEKDEYNSKIDAKCSEIARTWKTQFWPCESIEVNKVKGLLKASNIMAEAMSDVNKQLKEWYEARELTLFIKSVEQKVNSAIDELSAVSSPDSIHLGVPNIAPFIPVISSCSIEELQRVPFENFIDVSLFDGLYDEARQIYQTGSFEGRFTLNTSVPETVNEGLTRSKQACEAKIREIKKDIFQKVSSETAVNILNLAGLAPRLNFNRLFKSLCSSSEENESDCTPITPFIGALAVLCAHLKRLNRCRYFLQSNQGVELEREMQNPGHMNWSPEEHPEWLLLELELDIMIRPIQVEVAGQMMTMPNERNGVMQLNMGEGKTSVIVPMLCSKLAKKDSLCRVTVLNSIFKTNWGILKFAIGGLLNRRLYTFPCRRDMNFDEECLNKMKKAYKECLNLKGVVLTLPEHRLSFRLLAYDNIQRKKPNLGLQLLKMEDWLRKYARDVLDESDELLSVKYQLVYTIGGQFSVDGGEMRWKLCQRILDIVQEVGNELLDRLGSSVVEYDEDKKIQKPHEFAHVRLLVTSASHPELIDEFIDIIAERFLEDIMLTEGHKVVVKQFLIQNEIDEFLHNEVLTILSENSELLNKVLLLSGYLRRTMLSLALSKRWRVEYGVDPNGYRRMAVPFRAKDVAAEETEFGHPDLAIILTHLSYYYSGLTDTQLDETVDILKGKLAPSAIYSTWLKYIPAKDIPDSLMEYNSLNLNDPFQRLTLYGLIRNHKEIIDFWLSHKVFPKESKQFPGKLMMTAWDLVYERQRHPTTGFSGTNDSIVLLPLTISQQDLPKLQGTNDKMESILRQPENCGHRGFKMGATCQEILKQMRDDNLKVLIDAGALMLECNNEQVAELWLDTDRGIDAVVYFNKENELMVKTRASGREENIQIRRRGFHYPLHTTRVVTDVPFELSPFKGRLGSCGVFLDDQHCRGTDLKFPLGSKACVTIGSRMRREKLIQACLRMRKLGSNHSVAFYLSHEAKNKITRGLSGNITTDAILDWIHANTKEFNDDGLVYWAMAGKNYSQRLAAEDIFHFPNFRKPYDHQISNASYESDAVVLANQCVDPEITTLMEMYGQYSSNELLLSLIPRWFRQVKEKLQQLNNPNRIPAEITARIDEICSSICARCEKHIPLKTHISMSAMMEEEQEKELEPEKETEVEEERMVEPPVKCNPAVPKLHPNVVNIILNGYPVNIVDGIVRLPDNFINTSFWEEVQPECWESEVYATEDFVSVISSSSLSYYRTDSYLRPVEYMVSSRNLDGTVQLLLLSSFEVNEMLPNFRGGCYKCPLHMFTMRKFEKQNFLLNNYRLRLPPVTEPPASPYEVIPSKSPELAALLLASGSLYFNSMKEQMAFTKFLSLIPMPWSDVERKAFGNGKITNTCFIKDAEHRQSFYGVKGFSKDPSGLVRKILECHHKVLSEVTHVIHILEKHFYVENFGTMMDEEEDSSSQAQYTMMES